MVGNQCFSCMSHLKSINHFFHGFKGVFLFSTLGTLSFSQKKKKDTLWYMTTFYTGIYQICALTFMRN